MVFIFLRFIKCYIFIIVVVWNIASGIFLGLFGRGDKLKDYKYKGGHVDALTDD